MFIEEFFKGLEQNYLIQESGMFLSEQSKRETVSKVAKILHCTDTEELKIGSEEIDSMQFD